MSRRIIEAADWNSFSGEAGLFISLPWTTNAEGGRVELPIYHDARAPGPRVLVVGGTHGDEFEGQLAASSLIRNLPRLPVTGTITVLPRHHPAACAAGTRGSPIDGADLNRLYTGNGGTGATGVIANFVATHLLPEIDWLIDLHSGGATHEFVLSSNLQAKVGSDEDRRLRPALRVFGAPYAIIFDDTGSDTMPHLGTLEGAARGLGVKCVSSELGGAARLTRASARAAEHGLLGLLSYIGVLQCRADSREQPGQRFLRLDRADHYCRAPVGGLVVPQVELGQAVQAGEVVAQVFPDDPFGAEPLDVRAALCGIVAAIPTRARFEEGEMVVAVAEDA